MLSDMSSASAWSEAGSLLFHCLVHFSLLILPAMTVCILAVRREIHDLLLLMLIALSTIGITGYLSFWIFFASPAAGHIFAYTLPPVSIGFSVFFLGKCDTSEKAALRKLVAPAVLVCLSSLFIVSLGFLYGGLDDSISTAQVRFSHPLPADNVLPLIFADGVRSNHVPKPLYSEWRSSDRPPLQTGFVLLQYPFFARPRTLGYTVLCVILQSLWVFALWALLLSLRVDSRAIGFCLAICLFSGFVVVNSFFVWPKLLAAAFTLGAVAALCSTQSVPQHPFMSGVTFGSLATLAMLSHGAAVFALITFVPTVIIWRRKIPVRTVVIAALLATLLYLPWLLYQKLYDPPGDRLLKWHLAGVIPVDSRSFSQAFRDSYHGLSFQHLITNKAANLDVAADHQMQYWTELAAFTDAVLHYRSESRIVHVIRNFRCLQFYYFMPTLGAFGISPFALLAGIWRRVRSREYKVACFLWLCTIVNIVIWSLIMFGPGTTLVHQGPYAPVLVAYCASLLAFWAVSRLLAIGVSALHIIITVLLYVPVLDMSTLHFTSSTAVLAILSVAAIAVTLRVFDTDR